MLHTFKYLETEFKGTSMTDPTVRTIWSKNQQAELDRLITLKKQVVEENAEKIREFLVNADYDQCGTRVPIVEWLMNNAEGIRDLLEPFDERTRK